ncbi:hypothetical protein Sjap_008502 [Stephania japonica]|uniref:DUF8040 domain-containing protein n=1 Tax=Stephania japonica TaxID=461633 RepID=A0AAP0JPM0_9MAGN
MVQMFRIITSRRRRVERTYTLGYDRHRDVINGLVYKSNKKCYKMLRMDRRRFSKLCCMLHEHGNLKDKRCILVDEHLAITFHILGHNIRNRIISVWFQRSGDTVSYVFRRTVRAIIRMRHLLLARPTPISSESTDFRWKYFSELGADDDASNEEPEVINTVGPTDAWTMFRNNLAMEMWDNYN